VAFTGQQVAFPLWRVWVHLRFYFDVPTDNRIGENRQSDTTESGEASENLPLDLSCRPVLPFNELQCTDGSDDVAGL
jgi:hypothetical protein